MAANRTQVLRLYKDLVRYSDTLVYTDKQFYLKKARDEFRRNKDLQDQKDIAFYVAVSCGMVRSAFQHFNVSSFSFDTLQKGLAFLRNARLV